METLAGVSNFAAVETLKFRNVVCQTYQHQEEIEKFFGKEKPLKNEILFFNFNNVCIILDAIEAKYLSLFFVNHPTCLIIPKHNFNDFQIQQGVLARTTRWKKKRLCQ